MPLKLNSSGGGSVTLDVPSTASDFTATIPANTGTVVTTGSSAVVTQAMLASNVAGNGPAFIAKSNTNQTISNNTYTKVTLGTEELDTDSCFSSSRFTPNVAGYYFVVGVVNGKSSASTSTAIVEAAIYKNGVSTAIPGSFLYFPGAVYPDQAISNNSALVYLNGTADYVELYGRLFVSTGTPTILTPSWLYGFLVRAA